MHLQQQLEILAALLLCGVIAGGPSLLAWLRLPATNRYRANWQDTVPPAVSAIFASYHSLSCVTMAHSVENNALQFASRSSNFVMLFTALVLAAAELWGLHKRPTLLSWSIAVGMVTAPFMI